MLYGKCGNSFELCGKKIECCGDDFELIGRLSDILAVGIKYISTH